MFAKYMIYRVLAIVFLLGAIVPMRASADPSVAIVSEIDSTNAHALIMMHTSVYVRLHSDQPVGRIELRLRYPAHTITFLGAFPMSPLSQWEFFNWEHSPDSVFGDSSWNSLRLTAVADLGDGSGPHPDPSVLTLSGHVAELRFLTTNDMNFTHTCATISFGDLSCEDVRLYSVSGDSVYIPPGPVGSCPELAGKTMIDNVSALYGRVCLDNPYDLGDMNLDGIAFGIADAILFERYFTEGDSVWTPPYQFSQILASDFNDDGVVLTVADFVYLIDVITRGTWITFSP